jgi:hypothetical protein
MNMFGHLKAEDFTNLLEASPLPERRQAHLRACSQCLERLAAVQEIHSRMEVTPMDDEYIPEPDWSEFRSDVRSALLSRSVKRDHAAHSWFGGLNWRPALAWGVSMLLVFGVSLGVVWNRHHTDPESPVAAIEESAPSSLSTEDDLNSLASMARANDDVFDDLVHLDAEEAQSLQMILDEMTPKGVSQQ